MINIRAQILDSVTKYADQNGESAAEKERLQAAVLSGISLTANFLAGNDGHPEITPQAVLKAAMEAGGELGFGVSKLSK